MRAALPFYGVESVPAREVLDDRQDRSVWTPAAPQVQPYALAAAFLHLSFSEGPANRPGLVMLQIDGLSLDQFKKSWFFDIQLDHPGAQGAAVKA